MTGQLAHTSTANAKEPLEALPQEAVTALDLYSSISSLGSLDPLPYFHHNPLTFP